MKRKTAYLVGASLLAVTAGCVEELDATTAEVQTNMRFCPNTTVGAAAAAKMALSGAGYTRQQAISIASGFCTTRGTTVFSDTATLFPAPCDPCANLNAAPGTACYSELGPWMEAAGARRFLAPRAAGGKGLPNNALDKQALAKLIAGSRAVKVGAPGLSCNNDARVRGECTDLARVAVAVRELNASRSDVFLDSASRSGELADWVEAMGIWGWGQGANGNWGYDVILPKAGVATLIARAAGFRHEQGHTPCGSSSCDTYFIDTNEAIVNWRPYVDWAGYRGLAQGTASCPASVQAVPSPRPVAGNYLALGDSFSSGEGVAPYMGGTDQGDNTCHRSTMAYPRLLSREVGGGHVPAFWACSGATTNDVMVDAFKTEPRQLDRIGSNDQTITLSIGGNDSLFAAVVTACVEGTGDCRAAMQPQVNERLEALEGRRQIAGVHRLRDVYVAIANRAPNAKILVINYPELFSGASLPAGTQWCRADFSVGYVSAEEARWLDQQGEALNAVIARELTQARTMISNSARLRLVDVSKMSRGFGACRDESWFHRIRVRLRAPHIAESFHPNAYGVWALTQAVRAALLP